MPLIASCHSLVLAVLVLFSVEFGMAQAGTISLYPANHAISRDAKTMANYSNPAFGGWTSVTER